MKADLQFRTVTVTHKSANESFPFQTYTESDEASLEFVRRTFSDTVYAFSIGGNQSSRSFPNQFSAAPPAVQSDIFQREPLAG